MKKQSTILSLLLIVVVLLSASGCAKRILVSYDQLEKDNLIYVQTKSNHSLNGIVKAKQPTFLVLQTNRDKSSLSKIAKENIDYILTSPSVYDYQNHVISEWEIKDNQGAKNTVLYAIGGAGLSFGASFFMGSLIHRGISDSDYSNTALWTVTGVGTAFGTFFFTRSGFSKDRIASIDEIRERRYVIAQKEISAHKEKQENIKKELEEMKTNRKKQDDEMKRLMERLKERENKNKDEGDAG